MPVNIRQITFGSKEYKEERELRDEILRKPLGLKFSEEELANEKNCFHFGAFEGHELVGCLLLVPISKIEIKMRQVAVPTEKQGLGIGRMLVLASEEFARKNGFEWMKLSARQVAVDFYLSLGYEVVGDSYIEVTIPHKFLQKRIR